MAEHESLKQKLFLAFIVAVFSLGGSALGTALSSRYEFYKWQRETDYAARKSIIDKRIELLERTVRIFNKADFAGYLQLHGDSILKLSKVETEYAISKKHSSNNGQFQATLDRVMADALQRSELNVEFSSVLTLDAMYFGPKTRTAIAAIQSKEIDGKWWEINRTVLHDLLDAMYQEMYTNLDGK